ncbi:helicase [Paraburkholderia dinghuensis]|uniref:Helicase n=2 Tax=Paraburkholderia dinghuensis TaxID=2305225 RepID=A0A3N6NLC6_9BURK|nr:helicase [Paraburkholderia dinghuensis]
MQEQSIAYAAYWRNSLADAELGRGTLKKDELGSYHHVSCDEAESGILLEETVHALFSDEPEKVQFVEVVYRPLIYALKNEHGQRATQLPEFVTPLVTRALLSRDGCLLPKPASVVPRDILQPLEDGSFFIGLVDDLDRYLTEEQVPGILPADVSDGNETQLEEFQKRWKAYRDCLDRMLTAVCSDFISETRRFLRADYGLVLKEGAINGASQHIVRLYDHIRDKRPQSALFETYARVNATPVEPCLPLAARFTARLGHSSDKFPLASAQRAALAHLLAANDGEIVAVNGPPGTGKTTLLLSVVASLWAQAALDESEPPIIFAASTNNQAVTNVIDAFGKDFAHGDDRLGGRWLPDVRSFGSYFPSQSREAEASGKYQTNSFFDEIESREYVDRATTEFMTRAKTAFPDLDKADVKSVLSRLHTELKEHVARLITAEASWHALCTAKAESIAELGEDPSNVMEVRNLLADGLNAAVQQWTMAKDGWESYRANESLFYSFFSWLPPVAAKRLRQAREYLKTILKDESSESLGATLPDIEKSIGDRLDVQARSRDSAVRAVKRGEGVLSAQAEALSGFDKAARSVGVSGDIEPLSLEQCDQSADTKLRFQIFLLTTHYWEGRWLLEMESQMKKIIENKKKRKPGPATLKPRLRRRMMVTPCAVSTFAMLPSFLQTFVRGEGKFDADYLYNFADLLSFP